MASFLGRCFFGGKIPRYPGLDIPGWLRTVISAVLKIGREIFGRIDLVQDQGLEEAHEHGREVSAPFFLRCVLPKSRA